MLCFPVTIIYTRKKLIVMARKISAFDFDKSDIKTSRPGVHAKTKHSNHKQSKNYKKTYRGQGR